MVNHPNRKRAVAAAAATTMRRRPQATVRLHRSHDEDWHAFTAGVRVLFDSTVGQLFATDAKLNKIYLDGVAPERQVHDCAACHRFLKEFGHLATVEDDGRLVSVFWDPKVVPQFYRGVVGAMKRAVESARITAPFYSSDSVWGFPKTGEYTHFAVDARNHRKVETLLTSRQSMAKKREDHRTVVEALGAFTIGQVKLALSMVEAGRFDQSERFVAPLNWFANLHEIRERHSNVRAGNLIWREVARAPDGYCHVRASVTGSLLEDIAAGKSHAAIVRAFNAKMAPLAYQRPKAAPKAGNIEQAEKVFEKMGLQRSLERRFARLDEVPKAWEPFVDRPRGTGRTSGVFMHIAPKDGPHEIYSGNARLGTVTMTWEKFARTVLPGAQKLEVRVDNRDSFIALTAAVHDDAPPILKWDHDDERNAFAWYVYPAGSLASQWRTHAGWHAVNAVVHLPTMWGSHPKPHLGNGVVLAIDCYDTNEGSGNALFPACLRDELHGVRSTIEAYSRTAKLAGRGPGAACGIDVRASLETRTMIRRLRATVDGIVTEYLIDRWD